MKFLLIYGVICGSYVTYLTVGLFLITFNPGANLFIAYATDCNFRSTLGVLTGLGMALSNRFIQVGLFGYLTYSQCEKEIFRI